MDRRKFIGMSLAAIPAASIPFPLIGKFDPGEEWPSHFPNDGVVRNSILALAPLYCHAVKHKLPSQIPSPSTIEYYQYHLLKPDTLSSSIFAIDEYSSYKLYDYGGTEEEMIETFDFLINQIASYLDGSIINSMNRFSSAGDKNRRGTPHVIDIFENADGSDNLKFHSVVNYQVKPGPSMGDPAGLLPWNPADPMNQIQGWMAYKFRFQVACF